MHRRLRDLGIKPTSPAWRSIILTTKKSFNVKELIVPPLLFINFLVLKFELFMQRRLGDLGIKSASPMWRLIILTTKKSFNVKELIVPPLLFINVLF